MAGRSINTTTPQVSDRLARLLKRHHFDGLLSQYALSTPSVVLTTSSRRMLGHLNQLRYHVEYHLALPEESEAINLDHVEDICYNYLFSAPNPIKPGRRYVKPKDILATW